MDCSRQGRSAPFGRTRGRRCSVCERFLAGLGSARGGPSPIIYAVKLMRALLATLVLLFVVAGCEPLKFKEVDQGKVDRVMEKVEKGDGAE